MPNESNRLGIVVLIRKDGKEDEATWFESLQKARDFCEEEISNDPDKGYVMMRVLESVTPRSNKSHSKASVLRS